MSPALAIVAILNSAIEAYKVYQETHGSVDPTPEQLEANAAAWKAAVALNDLLANAPKG